jgi:hypothetical protein
VATYKTRGFKTMTYRSMLVGSQTHPMDGQVTSLV